MGEKVKNVLALVLVLTIVYSLGLTIWTFNRIDELAVQHPITGFAQTGEISFCINSAPIVDPSNCTINATQDVPYLCQVNLSDLENPNAGFSVVPYLVLRNFSNSTDLPFVMTGNGTISFTPNESDIGYYEYYIIGNDSLNCSNSITQAFKNLTIVNINDPPYLIRNIPNVVFYSGESVYGIYLNNFFADPDDDPLTYSVLGNSSMILDILPTSQVVVRSDACSFTEFVVFTAMDPYNLTANSNLVPITCIQPINQSEEDRSGGGGGGSIPPCKPEYECYEYHKCNSSNVRLMNCIDTKGCSKASLIPEPCVYEPPRSCNESWICTEWSTCAPNGTQARICVDQFACGTNDTRPVEFQKCEYIGTCTDGLKNCHDGSCEEGVDCGGPCGICQSVQVPYPFMEERGIWIYILTGLILVLLVAVLIYHYFRKEINAALAMAAWYATKKRRKQYLISKDDQRRLMAELDAMEKKLSKAQKKEDLFGVANDYSISLVYYLSRVLDFKGELESETLKVLLERKKRKVILILRKIFDSMHSDYNKLSKDANLVNWYKLRLMIEELRNIVLQTSPVTPGEYAREIQEFKPRDTDGFRERMVLKLLNTYIALQFLEVDVAKKKYFEIITDYEKLSEREEDLVYPDIARLFNNITYVNGWAWREKRA